MVRTKRVPPRPDRGHLMSRTSTPLAARRKSPSPQRLRASSPTSRHSPTRGSPSRRSLSWSPRRSPVRRGPDDSLDRSASSNRTPQPRGLSKVKAIRHRRPQTPGPSRSDAPDGGRGGRGRGRGGATRVRPGVRAMKEIKKYQRSTSLLIRHLPFSRCVRDIASSLTVVSTRWTGTALLALQEATEAFLVQLFEDANSAAIHSKRVTIMVRDMHLVRSMRSKQM